MSTPFWILVIAAAQILIVVVCAMVMERIGRE